MSSMSRRRVFCVNQHTNAQTKERKKTHTDTNKIELINCYEPSLILSLTKMPKTTSRLINVTFIRANGDRLPATGKVGDNLLDVVVNNNIDLDGFGACEGTLTCSTCHLIFTKPDYDRLPAKPCDEELDMLDLAYDLCDTSRLGCQVELSADMDGLEVRVPATINDARS